MLRILNLEEIQKMLLRTSDLIDLNVQHNPNFILDVKEWLSELEKILKNNNMPISANIASMRGILISAERGNIPIGIEFKGRTTSRKIREATSNKIIHQAVDLISNTIQKDVERVKEAERITRQLVAIAKSNGYIKKILSQDNYTEKLKTFWQKMANDQVLSQGIISVEGLVGPNDALVILDRTISTDLG